MEFRTSPYCRRHGSTNLFLSWTRKHIGDQLFFFFGVTPTLTIIFQVCFPNPGWGALLPSEKSWIHYWRREFSCCRYVGFLLALPCVFVIGFLDCFDVALAVSMLTIWMGFLAFCRNGSVINPLDFAAG